MNKDIIFVSMPFGPLLSPSLGLSLLRSLVEEVPSRVIYFTLSLAKQIGAPLYLDVSATNSARHTLVGEWIFAPTLFDKAAGDDEEYVERILRCSYPAAEAYSEEAIKGMLRTRAMADSFVDTCLDEVLRYQPRIVGFTNLHHQQVASLALAQRLKETAPDICVVFGGAGCDGMPGLELMRQFPFIDAMVCGEGELVFPELVKRVFNGHSLSDLPGVRTQENALLATDGDGFAPPINNLDDLPLLDFDDFFQQFEEAQLGDEHRAELGYEMSRGCWWGENHHCRFCGINGPDISFRSKSAERVRQELGTLLGKHPGLRVFFVDTNLSMAFFDDLIPSLAAAPPDAELFFQVRPTMNREQLRMLRDARAGEIQSGIESLSTEVLSLMHKGMTGLQNIQFLKWCREVDIPLSWIMIWGIPGEPVEEYQRLARLIPWLTHLPPPGWGQPLRLDRFSPYYDRRDEFGIKVGSCFPGYQHIYDLAPDAVSNLARSFTFEHGDGRNVAEYAEPVAEAVRQWREAYDTSDLRYTDNGQTLLIWDYRPGASKPVTALSGVQRALYLACDEICSMSQLERVAEEHAGAPSDHEMVQETLRPLVEQGLLIVEGKSALGLALPVRT